MLDNVQTFACSCYINGDGSPTTRERQMKFITNKERQAVITQDNYVIFMVSLGDNDFHVSFRKSGRSYKTNKGAVRAAQKWVDCGK